ncbi:MAG: cell division protein FtsH, partial [Caldilineales bacterium]|nr:cell division protein FtsH [Caldilineales bacterium]
MIYLVILAAVGAFLLTSLSRNNQATPRVEVYDLNQLAAQIANGQVKSILVRGDELEITYHNDTRIGLSRKEENVSLTDTLRWLGLTPEQIETVTIRFSPPNRWANWGVVLGTILPILLIGAFFFFIMRQAQG